MAHYAYLDDNNIVTLVFVGRDENDTLYKKDGATSWEDYHSKKDGVVCKRTSYNTSANIHLLGGTPFRKNFAAKGGTYDASRDAFIDPKPYASWVLDETTCTWQPPITMPSLTDEEKAAYKMYTWNETLYQSDNTKGWVLVG